MDEDGIRRALARGRRMVASLRDDVVLAGLETSMLKCIRVLQGMEDFLFVGVHRASTRRERDGLKGLKATMSLRVRQSSHIRGKLHHPALALPLRCLYGPAAFTT